MKNKKIREVIILSLFKRGSLLLSSEREIGLTISREVSYLRHPLSSFHLSPTQTVFCFFVVVAATLLFLSFQKLLICACDTRGPLVLFFFTIFLSELRSRFFSVLPASLSLSLSSSCLFLSFLFLYTQLKTIECLFHRTLKTEKGIKRLCQGKKTYRVEEFCRFHFSWKSGGVEVTPV
jgi:hypothetical protein